MNIRGDLIGWKGKKKIRINKKMANLESSTTLNIAYALCIFPVYKPILCINCAYFMHDCSKTYT